MKTKTKNKTLRINVFSSLVLWQIKYCCFIAAIDPSHQSFNYWPPFDPLLFGRIINPLYVAIDHFKNHSLSATLLRIKKLNKLCGDNNDDMSQHTLISFSSYLNALLSEFMMSNQSTEDGFSVQSKVRQVYNVFFLFIFLRDADIYNKYW